MTDYQQLTLPLATNTFVHGTPLLMPMSEMFTAAELADINNAAIDRGVSIQELIHDAVMNDLYR